MSAGNAPHIETGATIAEIDTEQLGFKSFSQGGLGPKIVQLLPQPWPADNIPPASASLLSVASKPGLLAAAGPGALVVTSTEGVRKAFSNQVLSEALSKENNQSDPRWEERDIDVVKDFTPDATIPTPNLRHVAFSTDGDFLVITAESEGGLAVFDVQGVVKAGKRDPQTQINTDKIPIQALLPNPTAEFAHYFAVVLESGRLLIANVDDGTTQTIKAEGVTCAAWSAKGKAVVAGLMDGSCAIHLSNGELKGIVPRPAGVEDGFCVSGLSWLSIDEFLVVHSQREQDTKWNFAKSNKGWTSFVFRALDYDPLFPSSELEHRAFPPRLSTTRLRNWQPDLNDMLVLTNSHTADVMVIASTSKEISPTQENCNEYMLATLSDQRKAAVPRTIYGEEGDSAVIGEALDLSSREKILRPVPALEEINEAPWPLPAYMVLTNEGVLAAWWIVWDRSVENGTRYPGLVFGSETNQSSASSATALAAPSPKPTPPATSSIFGKPTATFGAPQGGSEFGNAGFGSPTPALMKPKSPGFGTPAFGSTTPATTRPAQPAFGAPSAIGTPGGSGFGAAGGLGGKSSPWGTPAQPSQTQANPFSAAAGGASGFAKFGQPAGGSTFSSFGSNNGAPSGFASFGQGQQKSAFNGLKTEPSFGSTVTVGSGTTGSTLPSWSNTPAQQGSTLFGQAKSSFNTSSFESRSSDMSGSDDAQRRQRDDATPTPQAPSQQQSQGLFGLAGGFKLGTTFSSDGTAKDDPAKPAAPANGSFFASDFANTLGVESLKPPATPSKESQQSVSTTPASPPKQKPLFPVTTPAKDSATPEASPGAAEKTPKADDAPLPPDFITSKPAKTDNAPLPPDFINIKSSKSTDDELPPFAGSPGIQVEAPSSEVEVEPLDDDEFEDDDDEEGDGDEEDEDEVEEDVEVEEQSPSAAASKPHPSRSGGWNFHDSVNQSPRVFPPAPTPPAIKSGATSHSGRSASPAQPLFGQPSKLSGGQSANKGPSIFSQQPQKSSFAFDQSSTPAKSTFPLPSNRVQEVRSPSPVRSASTSAVQTRRAQLVTPGTSLSASIQQAKPPTPQPQVSDLEDEEDARMRAQLAQPIEPSRTLDEFVAYQNYTGKSHSKTGHAAQIEIIYKDINGMVDALGWNARSIKSFTEYHKKPQSGHEVNRHTLEDVADAGLDGLWFNKFTLCEIEALMTLRDELEEELDAGRVQNVSHKILQLDRLLRERAKLETRLNDIRRQIINRKDPDKLDSLRKAPLPKELADGQKALRKDYAQLLTSLNKAEEAATLLRTRVISQNAQNGNTSAVPTMERVKTTVIKMLNAAEQRNNNMTLLESQMRRVVLKDASSGRPSSSSSRTNGGTPRRSRHTSMRNSTADTLFATPPTNRNKMSLSELNRRALTPEDVTPTPSKGYGLFYTPEGSPTPTNQLARLSDKVDENIEALREKARRRKSVAGGLRKALVERGVRTTVVGC